MIRIFSFCRSRYTFPCIFLFFCLPLQLSAQSNNSSESSEFANFQKDLQDEYDDFRREINDEYISFLSQAWKEYRMFQGKVPDETPKPLSPVLLQEEKNGREEIVKTGEVIDKQADNLLCEESREEKDIFENTFWKTSDSLQLGYFGARLQLRYQRQQFLLPTVTEQSVGGLWKDIADSRFSVLLADMLRYKEKMQMNDWAYFLLTEKIAARMSTLQSEDCRTVFQHFFLVQSGYDVRLARVDRFLVLLLPVREEVYARPYLTVDGKQYYVFSKKNLQEYSDIFTYQLPEKLIQKKYLSLMIDRELLLPMQPKPFCIKDAGLEVKGEVNVNKIRFYQEYPSCELAVYARAVPDERLVKQVSASLSFQLSGKPFTEALNLLLSWVQKGFRYQTDGEQFGYEKPFFVEENFYYPACDCEDRSILFVCLVKLLFGKEVVLLDYPGHAATAVCVDGENLEGAYILLNGKKYIICDPTYINAEAGRVMSSYKTKRPKVIKL